MKVRRIQKKMTDLIDADMSEAVDVMKGLEIFEESKSKPEYVNRCCGIAHDPNPTVCCGHFSCDTAVSFTRRFSSFTFSEVIFLTFKASRSLSTISISKDSSGTS